MKLLILGSLLEQDMHGYELKKVIENRTGDFTNYQFGSIYYAIKTLLKDESIELVGVYDSKDKPSKKVYKITQKGKKVFINELKETLTDTKRRYYKIDEGIMYMNHLSSLETIKILKINLKYINKALLYLADHIKEFENEKMKKFHASLIIEHTIEHMKAEQKWLKKVIRVIGDS